MAREIRGTGDAGTIGQPSCYALETGKEETMGKGCLLWLLGVPIPVIIVLYLIFHH